VLPGALAALLLLTTSWRIEALVFSLLVGGVLGLACAAWGVHRRERLMRVSSVGLYPALLSFGRRLYLAGVIEHLNQYMSSLLVGLQLAARELAFFRLGQDRLQLLDQIPSAANSLLYPRIARTAGQVDQAQLTARCIRTMALILSVCGVAGAVLAPLAVWVLYGDEFLPMTWSIWILLPGVCALGTTSPTTQYLMGTGNPGVVWRLAIVPLIIQLVLLWPAIHAAGFRGAAFATSLAFVVHAIVRVIVLARITGMTAAGIVLPTRADRDLVWDFVRERLKSMRLISGR
jgi:O-antigen/teichoic acid export membrane protein